MTARICSIIRCYILSDLRLEPDKEKRTQYTVTGKHEGKDKERKRRGMGKKLKLIPISKDIEDMKMQ